jgi:bis(5'-nucleosyl)-tetraphosphatase (symmetrical)
LERTVYVGDVQGCREELEDLLEELSFDPAADRLEPVGDLVNRGPDSLGVLRLLRGLDAGGVLGNHDLHLLRAAAGTRPLRPNDTFAALLEAEDRAALLAWLAARPFAKRTDGVLLVHAGVAPGWKDPVARLSGVDPLRSHEDSDFCTRVRYCDARGRRSEQVEPPPRTPYRPWFEHSLACLGARTRRVVFGHWAQRGLVRDAARPGVLGLDTGCVWGGRLTAWIAEEDRLVSVPARRAHRRPG